MYKEKQIESTFPEIIEPNLKNKLLGAYINIQINLLQNSLMIT